MTFKIEGEYNTATVHTTVTKEEAEDSAIDQIQGMMDHPAFEGDNDVSIMPDFHWGAGAVIGLTMPVKNMVVPNTIGVDIGCGMEAANFGEFTIPKFEYEELDQLIREEVPVGYNVHSHTDYHIGDDFPWEKCEEKLESFIEHTDFDIDIDSVEYGLDYFKNVYRKVGYDAQRAINSMGTLGGGNHFIELGRDQENNVWAIIHSGSRGIGAEIAQYWQDKAHEHTFEREGSIDIPDKEEKYFEHSDERKPLKDVQPDGLSIDYEAVREDYDGEAIEGKIGQLRGFLKSGKSDENELDWLEGEEAHGYIIDMIFAQTYAIESRREMMRGVARALGKVSGETDATDFMDYQDTITSVHNYIDFGDATIRKGACRAHEGERLVVPFNMKYGTIIAEGKGKDSWNKSSAHGAGRAMGRRDAKRRFDQQDFEEQTEGVYMSEQPLDELPASYKDPEEVEAALGENIEIVRRIEPFLSVKAD